jgi:hypothetical protein
MRSFEQSLRMRKCFNSTMEDNSDDSGMWINPISNFGGKSRPPASYGESQNTRNSRFLELAEVVGDSLTHFRQQDCHTSD